MSGKNLLEIQQLTNLKQTYLIKVAILEGRYYVWPNMDSVVIVQALGKRVKTDVVKSSDCPYYNEFFTFDRKIDVYDLLDSDVVVTVVQPGSIFRKRKILGLFRLDVATIWAEPEHQFYNKWAVLNSPSDDKSGSGSRGFLKVNLAVITNNISASLPPVQQDNEIEGNLLLPHSRALERFNARFEFDIYRAEHLCDRKGPPSSFVMVSFGGNMAKTSVQKNTSFPVFNERIVIHDMYPLLCQKIHIRIYLGSTLYASDFLPLNYVTNEGEDGFLPKFGPGFLHMYDATGMETYKGSIFFRMRTKLEAVSAEDKLKSEVVPRSAPLKGVHPLLDLKFFVIIFESSALDKRFEGRITYKATMGSMDKIDDRNIAYLTDKCISDTIVVKKINRHSFYSVIKERKPMLTFGLTVIDYSKRLYNMNMLEKIHEALDKSLIDIGTLFEDSDISLNKKISDELSLCLDSFRSSTQKYIDIAENYGRSMLTELEQGKLAENLKLMKHLMSKAEKIFDPNALRRSFLKTKKLSDRVLCTFTNINDIWPDIFITVWKGNRELAYVRLNCKDVLHSYIEEEKGKMCGHVVTLYLQPERKKIPKAKYFTNTVGKMEVLLWLGTEKPHAEFLENLPGSFELNEESKSSPYLNIITKEKHEFQCRCHLFQGRIRPGNDTSALSDTMVRIHFCDDCQESTIEPETLTPVWNQTLIFRKLTQYGNTKFIKENPPSMIIELWDRDKLFSWEFIGRTVLKPLVKIKEEPYGAPRFPPKLQWFKVFDNDSISAEILAAFEMLEITGDPSECAEGADKDIIRIPDDIIPVPISFRMEVYFWGLRNLRKGKMGRTKRPMINIEYLKTTLYSEPLDDTKDDDNFENPIKSIDLQLPSILEYASPITIKIMDTRLWATSPIGIHTRHVNFFLETPLTEQERKNFFTGVALHESMAELKDDKTSEDSEFNLNDPKPHFSFTPKNCFCRTSVLQKLPKKISHIRCVCQKTRWQKLRQAFHRKKIICPCLKEHQENVSRLEKKHRKTCPCCRKILEKLRCVTNEKNIQLGFWSSLCSIFKSPCFGGKCECCKKVAEKIKETCDDVLDKCFFCKKKSQKFSKKKGKEAEKGQDESYDDNDYDWWTKYFSSSKPEPKRDDRISVRDKFRLKIYPRELESSSEFKHFTDLLMNFPMYKGKRTGDEVVDRDMVQGVFKGNIKMYRWPEPPGMSLITRHGNPLSEGYFHHFPPNRPLHFTVRVYCVRAIHLPPKDANGKCDPYLYIRLGSQIKDDKDNYKAKDLNPVFGKMFEFNGVFPKDHTLAVQIWDRDVASRDDLIGETIIDIENRLYTEHRAKCGLSEYYKETGYCAWRDQPKPTRILNRLCMHWNIPKPIYKLTSVKICSKVFESPEYESTGDDATDNEIKALYALRNWHQVPFIGLKLVPEHVETRSLYCPDKALVEQGKIQLWIDIFPASDLPPPRPVDISIKPPGNYELRVIIWNTADVLLQEDEFWTGQKKSDIYVKGMLLGHSNVQSTDVHYRSLTGEGNFNWRFIFPMQYLLNEDMTLIRRQEGSLQSRESDKKFPCRLTLQVWENDTFSKDDFLGTLSLDLSRMPRGSKGPQQCNLRILESNVPRMNIFKTKRTKGWWPFRGNDLEGNLTLVGKVEAEIELLTAEEALNNPAGLGRNAPQALPEPKRPKNSFNMFTNPFKTCRYIVLKHYKWKIITACCCIMLVGFVVLTFYAFPGYTVKKFLGV